MKRNCLTTFDKFIKELDFEKIIGEVNSIVNNYIENPMEDLTNYTKEINSKFYLNGDKSCYIVKAALPGIDKDDINIELTEDSLKISAEYKKENNNSIYSGSYSKKFNIDKEKINFKDVIIESYDNGMLTIILPLKQYKIEENKEVIKLEVK